MALGGSISSNLDATNMATTSEKTRDVAKEDLHLPYYKNTFNKHNQKKHPNNIPKNFDLLVVQM